MSIRKPGKAQGRTLLRLTAIAAGFLLATPNAMALWDDKLDVYVAERVTTDSNLFRVASGKRGDTYSTTTAGFNLDMPLSRQRFQAGASVDLVRYNRFSDLNHLGRNARALWLWELGNQLSGQLGYTERKALASFSNIPGRSDNNLKIQRLHGDAAYLLTPSWQLQAGIAKQAQRNSAQVREENDVDVRTLELAVNHISRAGNKIGVGLRQDDGDFLHRQNIGGTLYDNEFTQRAVDVHVDWAVTGKSHVKARLAQVRRSYDDLPRRDYDGTVFNASYDWQVTEKLGLSILAQRDISPDEDLQTSFVLVKGIAFRPSYKLSEKLRLSANADFSTREYLGDPRRALGTLPGRTDRVRLISATASYQPMRSLTLLLSGQRESRSSDYRPTDYDYTANILNLGARFTF